LGFSFAGGTSRLEAKRQLVVQEANAIGTAYLRLDEVPLNEQAEMRRSFRYYLDARLRVYERLPDLKAAEQELARAEKIQQEIWSRAVSASHNDPTQNTARLLLPALNEMIDVTTARTIAMHTQLPLLIFTLLTGVALVSGLLAGYAMAKRRSRSWLHIVLYAVVIAVTIYSVLDLEYPRFGLIRIDAADKALLQLRDSIR
jgi:non-ribosomal peptide synthetase component F